MSKHKRGDEPPREPPVIAGRVPPHDLDVEAAVLSACMLDRPSLDEVADLLKSEHFYSDANKLIYTAIEAIMAEADGGTIDIVTIASWLRAREQLGRIGGASYLGEIVDATPAIAHVRAHARIVYDKWRLRRFVATCQTRSALGYGEIEDVQVFLDEGEQQLFEITHSAQESTGLQVVREGLITLYANVADGGTGIMTGMGPIDRTMRGLRRKELTVVAARPGMGKTAFVLKVASNIAKRPTSEDDPVLRNVAAIFSLEMGREPMLDRLVAAEAGVDLAALMDRDLSPIDWKDVAAAAATVATWPLWIDDTPAITLLDMRAKLRRLVAEIKQWGGDLTLVVVDYLQLMTHPGTGSREQEVAAISRGLKEVCKTFNVPVVALAQLNRGVESRPVNDRRPRLSDLRESGAIEQDSDNIVFMFRPEYYRKPGDTGPMYDDRHVEIPEGSTEIITAKQRNGPPGIGRVRFVARSATFEDPNDDFDRWEKQDEDAF